MYNTITRLLRIVGTASFATALGMGMDSNRKFLSIDFVFRYGHLLFPRACFVPATE